MFADSSFRTGFLRCMARAVHWCRGSLAGACAEGVDGQKSRIGAGVTGCVRDFSARADRVEVHNRGASLALSAATLSFAHGYRDDHERPRSCAASVVRRCAEYWNDWCVDWSRIIDRVTGLLACVRRGEVGVWLSLHSVASADAGVLFIGSAWPIEVGLSRAALWCTSVSDLVLCGRWHVLGIQRCAMGIAVLPRGGAYLASAKTLWQDLLESAPDFQVGLQCFAHTASGPCSAT